MNSLRGITKKADAIATIARALRTILDTLSESLGLLSLPDNTRALPSAIASANRSPDQLTSTAFTLSFCLLLSPSDKHKLKHHLHISNSSFLQHCSFLCDYGQFLAKIWPLF